MVETNTLDYRDVRPMLVYHDQTGTRRTFRWAEDPEPGVQVSKRHPSHDAVMHDSTIRHFTYCMNLYCRYLRRIKIIVITPSIIRIPYMMDVL